MSKNVKTMLIILFIICIFYSIFGIVFKNAKEVYINSENEKELLEYISKEYNKPEKITKVKLRVLLGDGELSLYNGFILEKQTIINEGTPLFDYVCEYGISNTYKYISIIFISIIGLLVCKAKNNYIIEERK